MEFKRGNQIVRCKFIIRFFISVVIALILGCDEEYIVKQVNSVDGNKKLFLKEKVYPYDDVKTFVISKYNHVPFEADSTSEYVYYQVDCMFYEIIGDSLVVYTERLSNEPKGWNSSFVVIQKEISGIEYQAIYDNETGKELLRFGR